jgi:hypothetical protein
MHTNQRRARACVSYDSVMRDATTETRDLRVSVFHAGASRLCVSHVVSASERRRQRSQITFPCFKSLRHGFGRERKSNMGYEKRDAISAYCYGLLVGDDFQ